MPDKIFFLELIPVTSVLTFILLLVFPIRIYLFNLWAEKKKQEHERQEYERRES